MWAAILFVLWLATAVAFVSYFRRQRTLVTSLNKARAKLETEEAQVFDFLHGLGVALSDTSRPADLHVLIVEGAMRILNAQGGALYLSDGRDQLRPVFVSRNCPPFFEVPATVQAQAGKGTGALHGFLRLHSVRAGEGIIDSVWRDREAMLLRGEDARLDAARKSPQGANCAMFCPLVYAEQNLGVLVVSRDKAAECFLTGDFQIFRAIAEQSAFALSTATIFSEAAEKKRLDQDLQVAHEIQRILLPTSAPDVHGFQISGINIPARQVSGDYYDYLGVDAEHCGVAIADVSGKGIPASLIMAMCRSVLRSQASGQHSAAAVLKRVNEQLFPDIKEDMFISMAYAILERDSSTVTLCRAGHDAPLLFRAADRTVTRINPPGMALGIDSGGVFNRVTNDFSLRLETDDCLILYTDGVTEALNSQGEEFGMEKLIQSILASASEGAAGVITRLTDDLRDFIGTYPQYDDVTLIVIRKK
jgi:sigma-B regulation protein RsbU (phosphoserine phosphatase)